MTLLVSTVSSLMCLRDLIILKGNLLYSAWVCQVQGHSHLMTSHSSSFNSHSRDTVICWPPILYSHFPYYYLLVCSHNNKGNSYYANSIQFLSFLIGIALEADMAISYHKHFQEGKSGPISSWGTRKSGTWTRDKVSKLGLNWWQGGSSLVILMALASSLLDRSRFPLPHLVHRGFAHLVQAPNRGLSSV